MYLVLLSYTRPMDEVDRLQEPHIEWINRYFASGEFISAGRKDRARAG